MMDDQQRTKSILESLLFVARRPLSIKALEEATNLPGGLISAALEEMIAEYQLKGINIVKVAGGYLMGTNPDNADFVHNVLHIKVQTALSPQALETLSIIAYRQPITQAEIERIRGVNSDGPVNSLLAKKMIEDLGRSDAVGRPYLYGTTNEFLRHFGLKSLKDLPPLPAAPDEQEAIFRTALHEEETGGTTEPVVETVGSL